MLKIILTSLSFTSIVLFASDGILTSLGILVLKPSPWIGAIFIFSCSYIVLEIIYAVVNAKYNQTKERPHVR